MHEISTLINGKCNTFLMQEGGKYHANTGK